MAEMDNAAFKRLLAIIKEPAEGEIPIGDQVALVDPEIAGLIVRHDWYVHRGYAWTQIGGARIAMHRLIMGRHDGEEIDHKDGNRLNNRIDNLRPCTKRQNQQNRSAVCGRSKFKGVRRDRGCWRAEIKVDGRKMHIGVYPTDRLAAQAYDEAAREHFGEFAKTNEDLGLLTKAG